MKGLYIKTIAYGSKDIGGSIAHTIGMINGFNDAGVDLTVALGEYMELIRAKQKQFDVKEKSRLAYIRDYSYHYRMKRKILKWIKTDKPQFDFVYSRHRVFSSEGRSAAKLLNIPYILEFNSFDSEMIKESIAGAMYAKHSKFTNFFISLAIPVLSAIFMIGEKRDFKAANLIVVVSEVMKQRLVGKGIKEEKILVLPNGVDPSMFKNDIAGALAIRQKFGIPEDDITVGFAGTFGNWHGIPELTEAIKNLQDCKKLSFLLIGDGSEKGKMQKQIGSLPQVHFAGKVQFQDMPKYLSACDILIVSNSWSPKNKLPFFGSPTKLFEYMSMGKAIVASDLEQIGKILTNGETAMLFSPTDAKGMSGAVKKLADDEELRKKIGNNARELAICKYTWKQNAQAIENKLLALNGGNNHETSILQ